MNLLIVDDDAYVVEALSQKMDWESLGIENVYTAYNVKRAKRIIENVQIHIVICDIEMPKENGFQLLEWIRERRLVIQHIFLTSYAEFEYAKKAIELRSFAYTLKPIAYDELSAEVSRAVKAEEAALAAANYERIYMYWNDSEKNRKDLFWMRYCVNEAFLNSEEAWQGTVKLGLHYSEADRFIPLLCRLGDYDSVANELGKGMLEWTFKNIAEELFKTENSSMQAFISIGSMEWFVVIRVTDGWIKDTIYRLTGELIDKIQKHFKASLSCIMGKCTGLEDMQNNYRSMDNVFHRNIMGHNDIYEVDERDLQKGTYQPPNFGPWETFLKEGDEAALLDAVCGYLHRLSKERHLSKKVLHAFVMDLIQMLSSELKQRQILLHSVGDDCFDVLKIEMATQSFDDARNYLKDVIHQSMEAIRQNKKSMSVVDQVKDYIEHNLEKDITRESLADMVFLNPDYLARVFKKDVGESLGAFLVRRRIEKAKEYLEKTDDPVNTVAIKVGYDNFSYFSKVFKDMVGVTPKEYRKR